MPDAPVPCMHVSACASVCCLQKPVLEGKSWGVLPVANPVRRFAFDLVGNTWFERLVIAVILVRVALGGLQVSDWARC